MVKSLKIKVNKLSLKCFYITFIFCIMAGNVCGVEALCAKIRIQINQEATLERQAFDAKLKINNPLQGITLEDIRVEIFFADRNGATVIASSDPDDIDAKFFIMVDLQDQIENISGSGSVPPESSAEIHWLIIPAQGAGGNSAMGALYSVGAKIEFSINGLLTVVDVMPDSIIVKPMPNLVLDYFLPADVYGDDAFTEMEEVPIPFSLGLRVKNNGAATANNVVMFSSQPIIKENKLGLLIGFNIINTSVNDYWVSSTLNASLGAINPNSSSIARWKMKCSLSGKFVDFSAHFSHKDELGGQMTSLIDSVNTHLLVHDVLVDLPGRDSVRDFLADDGDALRVYESDHFDSVVIDFSAETSLNYSGTIDSFITYTLDVPVADGSIYIKKIFPSIDMKLIKSVVRSDGKVLSKDNAWLSKSRDSGGLPWRHYLNLFDVNGGGIYTIKLEDMEGEPLPPVILPIGLKLAEIGENISFKIHASDQNGRIDSLNAYQMPDNASFSNFITESMAEGDFAWTPVDGQKGIHNVIFTASDGMLHDSERVTIIVGDDNQDTNSSGVLRSLQVEQFVVSTDPMVVGVYTSLVCMANGQPAVLGLRAQCLVAPGSMIDFSENIMFPAPTTNNAVIIAEIGDNALGNFVPVPASEYKVRSTSIGQDAAYTLASDTGMPGFISAYIGATNDNYCGWLRIFSAENITNAVYYGDSCASNVVATPNELNCDWNPYNPTINIINPAYNINFISLPGCDNGVVTGKIVAVAGGANNIIPTESLLLEYRFYNDKTWNFLTTNFSEFGEFAASVDLSYPTNIWVRARVDNAWTPRAGLPISYDFELEIIPEPAVIIFGIWIFISAILWRKK